MLLPLPLPPLVLFGEAASSWISSAVALVGCKGAVPHSASSVIGAELSGGSTGGSPSAVDALACPSSTWVPCAGTGQSGWRGSPVTFKLGASIGTCHEAFAAAELTKWRISGSVSGPEAGCGWCGSCRAGNNHGSRRFTAKAPGDALEPSLYWLVELIVGGREPAWSSHANLGGVRATLA